MFELPQHLNGFYIKVFSGRYSGDTIEYLCWKGLTNDQFIKWSWYFEYRAALLRVKYPKNRIDTGRIEEPLTPKVEKDLIAKKIKAQRSKVTKYENKLSTFKLEFEQYKNNYQKLFPIEEEEEFNMYERSIQLAKSKIEKAKAELKELEAKFNN